MTVAILFLAVYSAVVTLAFGLTLLDRGHRLHVWMETRRLNKKYERLLDDVVFENYLNRKNNPDE